jgi:NAD(P)-dependent dehydrogenase (short-subunit alcohol dehydrogenase family)
MQRLRGRTAVITGAASGFGLELARLAVDEGLNVVLVDVQEDALATAHADIDERARMQGASTMARRVDVSDANAMDGLGEAVKKSFGAPNLVFNNAGVGSGGLVWENTTADWQWVLGVNVMGVVHGIRVFTPMMLAACKADADFEAHIVNTASMAGLVNAPTMGVYNASKHAVVSISESLHHDLALVTTKIHASVLCPFFVPTAIHQSHRNRTTPAGPVTASQRVAQAFSAKAVTSGKVTAADVARKVISAVRERQFYIYSHPQALRGVQTRMEDVVQGRNPTDPFSDKPEIGAELRRQLQGSV